MSMAFLDFHNDEEEYAWDDVKGAPHRPTVVKSARNEAMDHIRIMRVYDRVKRGAVLAAGHNNIKVRW